MDHKPLILLGALLLGGILIVNGMAEEKEKDEDLVDDIPSSIDYDDENLKRAMNPIDEEDEEEEDEL